MLMDWEEFVREVEVIHVCNKIAGLSYFNFQFVRKRNGSFEVSIYKYCLEDDDDKCLLNYFKEHMNYIMYIAKAIELGMSSASDKQFDTFITPYHYHPDEGALWEAYRKGRRLKGLDEQSFYDEL